MLQTAPFLWACGTDERLPRHFQSPTGLHTSTRGLPKDWRRGPGRPRHTWLRTLNADLHPLNHGLNSAWRLAQDSERWRQLVETATLQPGARSWWWWFLTSFNHFWSKLPIAARLNHAILTDYPTRNRWRHGIVLWLSTLAWSTKLIDTGPG